VDALCFADNLGDGRGEVNVPVGPVDNAQTQANERKTGKPAPETRMSEVGHGLHSPVSFNRHT
jgi:hypothetical protein